MNAQSSSFGFSRMSKSRRYWWTSVSHGLSASDGEALVARSYPKRVELQRASAHRDIYEAHFRCPIKFKANQNALVFSKADMQLPFVTHNADLLAIVAPQLEAELTQQLAQKTFSEQAKAILKQLLAGQRPGIQDLARELHLSTRTLQRRLTEHGITFQRLLEEARRELARHYLLHSSGS